MLKFDDYIIFDSLPRETLLKVLLQLNVKDVLSYCQQSKSAHNICDENFWHYYRTTNWPFEYLKDLMHWKSGPFSQEEVEQTLADRAPDPMTIGVPYKETAIALFFENSKIIKAQRRPYGYGFPYEKKKFLMSGYDKIVFYLQVAYEYAELLEGDYIAVFAEYGKNVITVRSLENEIMIPSIDNYPNKIVNKQDIDVEIGNDIDKILVKDIYVNKVPLIKHITDYIIVAYG